MPERTTYLPNGLPVPAPARDGLDAEFWAATKRHVLSIQRCRGCGQFQLPAEWVCWRCHGEDLGWEEVAPRGRIYSWERIWHPFHGVLRESCPYLVVLVELPQASDVRLIGNLLGDPEQTVTIGDEVEAVFEDHVEGDYTLVQWTARRS